MFFYSFLFPVIAVLAILWFAVRVRKGKNTISTLILWIILWITGIVSVNSLKVTGLDGVEHDILNELEDDDIDLDNDIEDSKDDMEISL